MPPRPLWTWSATGSVAGADPRWVWDEEADPLVTSLIERGDVPRVNELPRCCSGPGLSRSASRIPLTEPPGLRASSGYAPPVADPIGSPVAAARSAAPAAS
ncbi:hypothetical protein [Actinoplanes regularis]|uniref:hypothetical protein n=1 Tax=Actinoplanes regularis TaxID=52697 RepID=UPI00249FD268|nr:hypothetical protein [Actinoplanes regularis]GLW35602.1 hypothetical protein Areg01_85370 [Actinoplanes regularis]